MINITPIGVIFLFGGPYMSNSSELKEIKNYNVKCFPR